MAAVLLIALMGAASDNVVVSSLALTLSLIVPASLVMLRVSRPKASVKDGVRTIRQFKRKEGRVQLSLEGSSRFLSRPVVVSVEAPRGVDGAVEMTHDGQTEIVVKSVYSGRFVGFRAWIEYSDPLRLFVRTEALKIDLVLESLPLSLASVPAGFTASPIALGEIPSSRRGFAQEFYGAEDYDRSHEAKDILWKRLAKLEEGRLMARVKEANIPTDLAICLLELGERSEEQTPRWMDLVCEAVSKVGMEVLRANSVLKILRVKGRSAFPIHVRNRRELADAVMALWQERPAAMSATEAIRTSSMVITGELEFSRDEVLAEAEGKPFLVATDRMREAKRPGLIFFSSSGEVGGIVELVFNR